MDLAEYIKLCLVKRKTTLSRLAELTEQSQPNLSNKMKRNHFDSAELEKIAAALNCELNIQFIDKDTKEPLI